MKTLCDLRRLVVCAMLAAACGQAQNVVLGQSVVRLHSRQAVEAPSVGKMVDTQGTLRTVSGIAGNFLAGPGEAQSVVAFDCSGQACVTAPDTEVLATDGRRVVGYLTQSNAFSGWDLASSGGGRSPAREPLAWNPVMDGDEVLSLRLTPSGAEIAVRRGGTVWIVSQDGAALGTLPADATGAVLLLDDGAMYARQDAVVLRRDDGTETSFPAPGVRALYRMSPDWVEAVALDALYAVRTTLGRENVYVLPTGVLPGGPGMIARAAVLALVPALILCSAARADVTLFAVVNNAEIAAVSPFSFGNVAQGDTKTVRFRMRNASAASATQVTVLGASGAGFALNGQPPIPFVLAPGAAQDFNVIFTAIAATGSSTSYSGNLQVNGISLTLLASASPAPGLTVLPPCSGTSASAGAAFSGFVDFGQVPAGQLKACDFQLANQANQSAGAAETISTFTVTGAGFQGPIGLTPPVTLAAQQSSNFSIDFMTAKPGIYTGTLTYASRTFQLTATVFAPLLPAPVLSFDTTLVNSGEQHTLSMRLPTASTIDASGNVSLTFLPDSPVVSDDPAILFVATGTRTLPFSVKAGSTQILIGGASGAVFQTGTSSGRIHFTVSGVAQGVTGTVTTELRIPPSTVAVDAATFTERLGNLDVQVTGFDNTYTAGVMAFTFYDGGGNAINPGTIQADFTSQFRAYFTTSTSGSMFLMGVTFPISGSQVSIAAADVALVNAAGSATIRKLALQ